MFSVKTAITARGRSGAHFTPFVFRVEEEALVAAGSARFGDVCGVLCAFGGSKLSQIREVLLNSLLSVSAERFEPRRRNLCYFPDCSGSFPGLSRQAA